MNQPSVPHELATSRDEEISLFALGTTLLRNRWRIAGWMAVGGIIAAASVITKPKVFAASASFISQGNDASRSNLAGLAGQFGVQLPISNPTVSPEFYSTLIKSRVLLEPIVRDTFTAPEGNGGRISFLDLFGVRGDSREEREQAGVKKLADIVETSIGKGTGVVEVVVPTKWRSVSLKIVTAIVDGVNEYNQRTRQSQAAAERRFIDGQLKIAAADLRSSEDRMAEFLAGNRILGNAQSLERDRLQRDVTQKQLEYNSLRQASADARIREVRDTPVISIFEPPEVPVLAEPRGRLKRVAIGLVLGALIGALLAFTREMLARRTHRGDSDAEEFVGALRSATAGLTSKLRPRAKAGSPT